MSKGKQKSKGLCPTNVYLSWKCVFPIINEAIHNMDNQALELHDIWFKAKMFSLIISHKNLAFPN